MKHLKYDREVLIPLSFILGSVLGGLVNDSKSALPWFDYRLIEEIVDKRNGIAHRGETVPKPDCFRYIDAIQKELSTFGILVP